MINKPNGETAVSNVDKAEVFNAYFGSVFTHEDSTNVPEFRDRTQNVFISDIEITEEIVLEKLLNLNPTKSMGPDGLHPHFLKKLATEISYPLTIIFNSSLSTSIIPDDWKIANLTAIFKKGNKCETSNYRPVSLTCILCKVFEKIIKESLVSFLESENLFNDCQHGFRQHRSCITQFLYAMDDFTSIIDRGASIDVIYLDFQKAFDSVPHERLFVKLNGYGIKGNVYNWIKSFLTGRRQRVAINDEYSSLINVDSGVPQGSVLGPLLFILFINDLPDIVQSFCRIFADDTKLYAPSSNHMLIQNDLLSLKHWSQKWQLNFNESKCKVLHIGKHNPYHTYHFDIPGNTPLTTTNFEKDLGVIFDNHLHFDIHIDSSINRANRLLGVIRRTFTFLDKYSFLTIYKSLVRPILEYGNCIWSPIFKRQSIKIENVQRRATRLLPELLDMSYDERLKQLDLSSLKYRRKRGDLIQLYKLVHKIDNIDSLKFFSYSKTINTRGDRYKIFIDRCITNLRLNSFIRRTVGDWNNLCFATKDADNLNCFKNYVDKELSKIRFLFDE